jgi:membrane protease YdiL (CAAX protease family)
MIAKQNGTASLIVEGIVANSDTVQAAINNFLVELMNLPVYILSGFTFAFFYCFTGKIATSMFAHSLNNTLSVILVLVSFAISQNSNINISSFLIR